MNRGVKVLDKSQKTLLLMFSLRRTVLKNYSTEDKFSLTISHLTVCETTLLSDYFETLYFMTYDISDIIRYNVSK